MRSFPLVASFVVIWISIASCCSTGTSSADSSSSSSSAGSTGAGGGGDEFTAIVETFCNEVARPFCEANWTCCARPGYHLGDSVDDCTKQFIAGRWVIDFCAPRGLNLSGDREDLEASLRAGTTIFDKTQFDTCLAFLKSMSAGGTACIEPPEQVVTRECANAFRGLIPPGEPCKWLDFLFADSVMQCKDGRCEVGKCVPFLKVGDTCPSHVDDWAQPANTICNYRQAEWCKRPDVALPGTCAPMGEIGDACDPGNSNECKGLNCDGTGKCGLPDPLSGACLVGFP